jgi:predicted amidohydrolase
MKVYIGQINPTVGALASNAELIHRAYRDGVAAGADVVLVPELAVTGYPPLDLLDREIFINSALEVRDALVRETGKTTLIFGCITRNASWCGKPRLSARTFCTCPASRRSTSSANVPSRYSSSSPMPS